MKILSVPTPDEREEENEAIFLYFWESKDPRGKSLNLSLSFSFITAQLFHRVYWIFVSMCLYGQVCV